MICLPRFALLILLPTLPLCAQHPQLQSAKDGDRFVVDTNVACKSTPGSAPETLFPIPLGASVTVSRAAEVEGVTWYLRPDQCWVSGPGTAVFYKTDPNAMLLAMIDHILARTRVPLDDYVAVENYLLEDPAWRSASGRARAPGLLRFRHLQLLDRALATKEADLWASNALVRSWLLTHRDVIEYDELGAEWYVATQSYWKILDAYRTAPWAEELAWFASTRPAHSDECNFACQVKFVEERQAQYWTRFPTGPHIGVALARAGEQLRAVANDACQSADTGAFYTVVPRRQIAALRSSLARVSDPAKQDILVSLTEMERKCTR